MFNRRFAFIATIGASVGGMMSGILSSIGGGLPNFFSINALNAPTPFREHRATRKVKRRPGATHRGWTPNYYEVAGPISREAERRRRQGAHHLQRLSHKPGTVQPRHIFGGD